ncbi:microtubule-associated protein 2 isoform X2 [Adelges cooleyi]|uniref:microtubule-associated protein 2 isoform X2 n=1 Tax=Adelges cooleyi TaxID=133065 RepID=UPI00217FA2C1|nr:microtubule-associated protein 2 isoform X2 [Adelges cooleyi]
MDNNRRNSTVDPGGSLTTRMQFNMTTTLPKSPQQRTSELGPRPRPDYYPQPQQQQQGPYQAQPPPQSFQNQNRPGPPNAQRPPPGPPRPPSGQRPAAANNPWNLVRQALPADGVRGPPPPLQRPPYYNMQQQQQRPPPPPQAQDQYRPPPPPVERRPTLSRIEDRPTYRPPPPPPENVRQKPGVVGGGGGDDDDEAVVTSQQSSVPPPPLNRRDSTMVLPGKPEAGDQPPARQWPRPVQGPSYPNNPLPPEQYGRPSIPEVQERYNERPEPQKFQTVNYNRQDDERRPNIQQNGPKPREYGRRDSVLEQPRIDAMRRNDSMDSEKSPGTRQDTVKRPDYRKPLEQEELRRAEPVRRPEPEEVKRPDFRRPSVQELEVKRPPEYRRPEPEEFKRADYRRPSEKELEAKRLDYRRPEPEDIKRVDLRRPSEQEVDTIRTEYRRPEPSLDRLSRNVDQRSYAPERRFSIDKPLAESSYMPKDQLNRDLRKSNFEATYLKTVREIGNTDDKYTAEAANRPLERRDDRRIEDRRTDDRRMEDRRTDDRRIDDRKTDDRRPNERKDDDRRQDERKTEIAQKIKDPATEPSVGGELSNRNKTVTVKEKDERQIEQNKNTRPDTLKINKDHEPLKESSIAKGNQRSDGGDVCKSPSKIPKKEKSELKTPTRAVTPKSPESVTGQKKLSMNKVQVGSAPSPNLKVVRSKVDSLQNTSYKPGGGQVKIEHRKLEWKAGTRIQAKNDAYVPGGGDKKIQSVKLQWNAKPKVGSLENKTHKPGGGDKKIETVKLDFKDKAKPKIGSKDNIKHTPGGGAVKIEDQKIEIKAQSKVGSLDNVKHKPGGGEVKIFDDKTYIKQTTGTPVKSQSSRSSQADNLAEQEM